MERLYWMKVRREQSLTVKHNSNAVPSGPKARLMLLERESGRKLKNISPMLPERWRQLLVV